MQNPTLGNPNDPLKTSDKTRNSVNTEGTSNNAQREAFFSAQMQRENTGRFSMASAATRFSFMPWRNSNRSNLPGVYEPNIDDRNSTVPLQEATTLKRNHNLNLGAFNFVEEEKKPKYSKKFIAWNVLLFGVIIALFGLLALGFATAEENESESANVGENPDCPLVDINEPTTETDEFSCGSPDKDDEIRSIIADNIVIANEAKIERVEGISCWPRNAFGALSDQQRSDFENALRLTIDTVGLKEIKSRAFEGLFLFNIQEVNIINNGLSSLPDSIFADMPSVETIVLDRNAFVTLDNNIFGDGRVLNRVSMLGNSGLVRFPGFIGFHSVVGVINLVDTGSLVRFEEGAASGVVTDILLITGSKILDFFVADDLASGLGFAVLDTIRE